ncbi:MAG: hypothetical protein M3454_01095 [Actinomycetota bacterium]|nr:hypothetical protein [Actinomycetota bacterium]
MVTEGSQLNFGATVGAGDEAADGRRQAADPVCGMSVAVTLGALSAELRDTTYYFCGTGCRDSFMAPATSTGA